jgi:hypothetical protein
MGTTGPSQITVLPHPPYSSDLAPVDYHLFSFKKKAFEFTITPVMIYSRAPCASGCKGWRATFTRWDGMLLFRGGRRLLAKMENML